MTSPEMFSSAEHRFSAEMQMFIRSRMCLVIAGLALSVLLSSVCGNGEEQRGLVLTVKKSPDKDRAIPGSSLYTADLRNSSSKPQVLQAIQMPGGYAGEGKFFSCSLDAWNAAKHKWISLWTAESGHSSNLRDVELRAGEHLQVCGLMLPTQAGRNGQCVRFRVRMRWNESPRTGLASNPILIGENAGGAGPCRAKE
jgi:hypothetical protein